MFKLLAKKANRPLDITQKKKNVALLQKYRGIFKPRFNSKQMRTVVVETSKKCTYDDCELREVEDLISQKNFQDFMQHVHNEDARAVCDSHYKPDVFRAAKEEGEEKKQMTGAQKKKLMALQKAVEQQQLEQKLVAQFCLVDVKKTNV